MMRFLKPDFLAVFVATLALVASQFPPAWKFLTKPKLNIKIGPQINVSHKLGWVHAIVPITLSNDGNEITRVDRLQCTLKNAELTVNMEANLFVVPTTGAFVSLMHGTIRPGESHLMHILCVEIMPESWATKYQKAKALYDREIAVRVSAGCNQTLSCGRPLPDPVVNQMLELWEHGFDFSAGDFIFEVNAVSENGALKTAISNVAVSDQVVAQLYELKDEINAGTGLSLNMMPWHFVVLDVK